MSNVAEYEAVFRGLLAARFGVDESRIAVRVTSDPDPSGGTSMRIEVDLDDANPPKEWGEFIKHVLHACDHIARSLGHDLGVEIGASGVSATNIKGEPVPA